MYHMYIMYIIYITLTHKMKYFMLWAQLIEVMQSVEKEILRGPESIKFFRFCGKSSPAS